MNRHHPNGLDQQGIAMSEALVALLVLALGVLGLSRIQVGALTESRNTNARAMAVLRQGALPPLPSFSAAMPP